MELWDRLWEAVAKIAAGLGLEGLSGVVEYAEAFVALALGLIAALLIYKEFTTCYRLLRRVNANTPRGARAQVAHTVLRLAFTDRALFSVERRTLVRRTRILIEHELFDPRPQFDWRDGGIEPRGLFGPLRRHWAARRIHRAELKQWRAELRDVLALEGDWTIDVDNPALVSERMEQVQAYFQCLASLGFEGDEADRFICPIEISSGFIAPLHLLTGLLVQFNEKWRPILESFDRDANESGAGNGDASARDLRQIQLFIYNCWLLWGPSVPICECRNWAARYAVVQYGYGDENNSIEVVGKRKTVAKSLARLMEAQIRHERALRTVGGTAEVSDGPYTGMAAPANVVGRLRLSTSLAGRKKAQVNALPAAALESWGGGQDARPVLFISEIVRTNAVEGDVVLGSARRGRISADDRAYPSRYYSAYLWAALVVLVDTPAGPQPLSRARGAEGEPWKDLIPFFEHGNLADPESCLFAKRQLAAKVVAGLASAVAEWAGEEVPVRFAFACAIDEAGCGHDLAFPDWSGHHRMRDLIREALGEKAVTDPAARRIAEENLLDFEHFSGAPGRHDFSACRFPGIVGQHYASMEASAERKS
ncbi:MAG: hypothetical protein P0Y56_02830 [Candidatus Andeanibacterium colombiense]|uniref:Uncharacterized protein n=1 Tax=Candidatus Andeanibacterium colombiense TaxID=3121345 RepID=A0AAJ5X3T1_9SPHN|nr:MAG: hypothetical protein P0Y56_02830 [Sphingomonadaceae bacterium]